MKLHIMLLMDIIKPVGSFLCYFLNIVPWIWYI